MSSVLVQTRGEGEDGKSKADDRLRVLQCEGDIGGKKKRRRDSGEGGGMTGGSEGRRKRESLER